MKQSLGRAFLILGLLVNSACVEHKFIFHVHPEGNFDVVYHAHGDRADLLDADFTLPGDTTWHIVSTLDVEEAESYEYAAEKWFQANAPFPKTFFDGDSILPGALLLHPTEITMRRWPLNKTYLFKAVLKGRGVSEKYPALAESFKSEEGVQWMQDVVAYIFRETLHRSEVGFNLEPILKKELENWLEENILGKPDSLLVTNLDNLKQSGLALLKQPLEERYYPVMDSIFKMLRDEARITYDLGDDEFEYRLILPGTVQDTNADTTLGDTMVWNFSLEQYINDDYIMTARSRVIYPWRYKLIILAILLFGMYLWIKAIKTGKSVQVQ